VRWLARVDWASVSPISNDNLHLVYELMPEENMEIAEFKSQRLDHALLAIFGGRGN
jgi:hypothetical protein